jgi:hypothetical protein
MSKVTNTLRSLRESGEWMIIAAFLLVAVLTIGCSVLLGLVYIYLNVN